MSDPSPREITRLLVEWRGGSKQALDDLLPLVYAELKRLARHHMQSERSDHTLQATALVHEAYARLVDSKVSWKDRAHFFAVAARSMRRILVDHARSHRSAKRGEGAARLPLDEQIVVSATPSKSVVELDEALTRLAAIDERKSRVIELHFFGGLTHEEIAEALGISPATVYREMSFSRAWLRRDLDSGKSSEG